MAYTFYNAIDPAEETPEVQGQPLAKKQKIAKSDYEIKWDKEADFPHVVDSLAQHGDIKKLIVDTVPGLLLDQYQQQIAFFVKRPCWCLSVALEVVEHDFAFFFAVSANWTQNEWVRIACVMVMCRNQLVVGKTTREHQDDRNYTMIWDGNGTGYAMYKQPR
jgi:hypothetical protein